MTNVVKYTYDFSQATELYDLNAFAQKISARTLVSFIKRKNHFNTITDLGCGTGFIFSFIDEQNVVYDKFCNIDISMKMLEKAKINAIDILQAKGSSIDKKLLDLKFLNIDATSTECLNIISTSDLILSNFTIQWFSDIFKFLDSVIHAIKNNTQFLFSIPVEGSLSEIAINSIIANKKNIPLMKFPNAHEILEHMKRYSFQTNVTISLLKQEKITKQYSNALDAIRGIKKIGAGFKFHDHRYNVREFKRLLTQMDKNRINDHIEVSYMVAYFSIEKH